MPDGCRILSVQTRREFLDYLTGHGPDVGAQAGVPAAAAAEADAKPQSTTATYGLAQEILGSSGRAGD